MEPKPAPAEETVHPMHADQGADEGLFHELIRRVGAASVTSPDCFPCGRSADISAQDARITALEKLRDQDATAWKETLREFKVDTARRFTELRIDTAAAHAELKKDLGQRFDSQAVKLDRLLEAGGKKADKLKNMALVAMGTVCLALLMFVLNALVNKHG